MFGGGEVTFNPKAVRAFKADIEAACAGRLDDVKTDEVRTFLGLPPLNEAKKLLSTNRMGNNGFIGQTRFRDSAPPLCKDPHEFLASIVQIAYANWKKAQGE